MHASSNWSPSLSIFVRLTGNLRSSGFTPPWEKSSRSFVHGYYMNCSTILSSTLSCYYSSLAFPLLCFSNSQTSTTSPTPTSPSRAPTNTHHQLPPNLRLHKIRRFRQAHNGNRDPPRRFSTRHRRLRIPDRRAVHEYQRRHARWSGWRDLRYVYHDCAWAAC
jgi:hypothetical protein